MAVTEGSPEVPDFKLQFLHPGLVDEWQSTASPMAAVKMWIWLLERMIEGPPHFYGHTDEGFPYSEGPSGEIIEYVHKSKPLSLGEDPPVGVTIIRRITNPGGL